MDPHSLRRSWFGPFIALLFGGALVVILLMLWSIRPGESPEEAFVRQQAEFELAVDAFEGRADGEMPPGVEMIFWEWQSWEVGGSSYRLTLWADGRSQLCARMPMYDPSHSLVESDVAWTQDVDADTYTLVRDDVYPPAEAQRRFREAFRLGIHELEPIEISYADGGGLLLGIQIDGQLTKEVHPYDVNGERSPDDVLRFAALCRLLGQEGDTRGLRYVRPQQPPPASSNTDTQ